MIATFVQEGDAIEFTPVADVAAGDVVVSGELVGVSKRPVKAGELGSLAVEGVFDLPKATSAGSAIAAGTKVNWDATAKVVTTAPGPGGVNKYVGKTVLATADADATARVRLSQ